MGGFIKNISAFSKAQGKTPKDYFNYASSIADSPSKKDTKSKDPIIGILNKAKITKKKKLLGTER
tara:strand:- start:720 stop:914 length:195 start_codon:yes stop_codon:yes gene_type:complete